MVYQWDRHPVFTNNACVRVIFLSMLIVHDFSTWSIVYRIKYWSEDEVKGWKSIVYNRASTLKGDTEYVWLQCRLGSGLIPSLLNDTTTQCHRSQPRLSSSSKRYELSTCSTTFLRYSNEYLLCKNKIFLSNKTFMSNNSNLQ